MLYTLTDPKQNKMDQQPSSSHAVLVHGYILSGTGSNIYSVNIGKTWKKQGHAVTIVCQDRQAGSYPFVDEYVGPGDDLPAVPPAPGTIRVVVPDIDGLLPVYVYDDYEGYTVKTIPDCTEVELENHIEKTAKVLRQVLAQGAVRVLSNHCLLSPVITKRACEGLSTPYDVKVHGSAITFVIKPHPRLKKYALEGLQHAEKIIAGTSYIVN